MRKNSKTGIKNWYQQRSVILLEVAFYLAEESVHLNILLLIKFLTDPGQTGQNNVHKPVRTDLQVEIRALTTPHSVHRVISSKATVKRIKKNTLMTKICETKQGRRRITKYITPKNGKINE